MPAAPSSARAGGSKRASCLGSRLAASASERARRAASTSARQGDLGGERRVRQGGLGGRAPPARRPHRRSNGDQMGERRAARPVVAARVCCETRRRPGTGPSRLISTAASRGESKLTVAAEWTTVEQVASSSRPASSRPRPSSPTSPASGMTRRGHLLVEAVAELAPQAVEAVVPEHLAVDPVGSPPAGRGGRSATTSVVRQAPQEPLGQSSAEEPGGAGDGDAPARQAPHGASLVSTTPAASPRSLPLHYIPLVDTGDERPPEPQDRIRNVPARPFAGQAGWGALAVA